MTSMLDAMQAAAEKVTATIHEHREQGDGFATLCRSLGLKPADLDTFVAGELDKLNGSGTPDGALMHGLLIGAVLAHDDAAGDGINWELVGSFLPPHELRSRILRYLRDHSKASPNQMAVAFDESLGNVSYHVSVLAGKTKKGQGPSLADSPFLELVDEQPRRGAVEHFYALTRRVILQPVAVPQEGGDGDAA